MSLRRHLVSVGFRHPEIIWILPESHAKHYAFNISDNTCDKSQHAHACVIYTQKIGICNDNPTARQVPNRKRRGTPPDPLSRRRPPVPGVRRGFVADDARARSRARSSSATAAGAGVRAEQLRHLRGRRSHSLPARCREPLCPDRPAVQRRRAAFVDGVTRGVSGMVRQLPLYLRRHALRGRGRRGEHREDRAHPGRPGT